MLENELRRRGKSERELAREFGWSQQAFNSWRRGGVPRQQFFVRLGNFLGISQADLEMLVDEAKESAGNTKMPDLGAPVLGQGSPDELSIDMFPTGFAKPAVSGTYALKIDGKHAWINPRLKPTRGNEVVIRVADRGRLAVWPAILGDDEEAHVVVLRETV